MANQLPRTIRTLRELDSSRPTVIDPNTEINIPGLYPEWNGNGENCAAKGARWTVRDLNTGARVRDLVIG